MFSLQPPRHIPTLPIASFRADRERGSFAPTTGPDRGGRPVLSRANGAASRATKKSKRAQKSKRARSHTAPNAIGYVQGGLGCGGVDLAARAQEPWPMLRIDILWPGTIP
jgi:hypothetical protein